MIRKQQGDNHVTIGNPDKQTDKLCIYALGHQKPSDKLHSYCHINGTLQYMGQVIVQHHIVIVLREGGKGGLPGTSYSLHVYIELLYCSEAWLPTQVTLL